MASYDVPARHPSGRLPFSYQRLPGPLRFWLSRWLIGGEPLSTVDLRRSLERDPIDPATQGAPGWPGGRRVALGLSHDVDTDRGVAEVAPLIELEARLGVRSTLFVPGDVAVRHERLVRAWQARGWEVALHGARHDNRLASLEGAALEQRLADIHGLARRFGMRGFRAPSFWVCEAQLSRLGPPLVYDSSVPAHRPATRISPERGARTCRPFRVGAVLELPVALPLDDDLLREGLPHTRFHEVRARYVAGVAARGGVAVLADHTEPHLSGHRLARAAYAASIERFLDDGAIWMAPLLDIAVHFDRSPSRDLGQPVAGQC